MLMLHVRTERYLVRRPEFGNLLIGFQKRERGRERNRFSCQNQSSHKIIEEQSPKLPAGPVSLRVFGNLNLPACLRALRPLLLFWKDLN